MLVVERSVWRLREEMHALKMCLQSGTPFDQLVRVASAMQGDFPVQMYHRDQRRDFVLYHPPQQGYNHSQQQCLFEQYQHDIQHDIQHNVENVVENVVKNEVLRQTRFIVSFFYETDVSHYKAPDILNVERDILIVFAPRSIHDALLYKLKGIQIFVVALEMYQFVTNDPQMQTCAMVLLCYQFELLTKDHQVCIAGGELKTDWFTIGTATTMEELYAMVFAN